MAGVDIIEIQDNDESRINVIEIGRSEPERVEIVEVGQVATSVGQSGAQVPDPSAATNGALLQVQSGVYVLTATLEDSNLVIDGGIIE